MPRERNSNSHKIHCESVFRIMESFPGAWYSLPVFFCRLSTDWNWQWPFAWTLNASSAFHRKVAPVHFVVVPRSANSIHIQNLNLLKMSWAWRTSIGWLNIQSPSLRNELSTKAPRSLSPQSSSFESSSLQEKLSGAAKNWAVSTILIPWTVFWPPRVTPSLFLQSHRSWVRCS